MTNTNTNETKVQETSTKMFKKDWLDVLKNIVESSNYENKEDAIKFLEHEKEILEKKSAKSGMTKVQKENLEIMGVIKTVIAEMARPVTISELQKDSKLNMYTPQKISALVRKLLPKTEKNPDGTGEVIRVEEKKVAYFSLADATPTIAVKFENVE